MSHWDASKDMHITTLRRKPVGVRKMLWSGTDPDVILSADLHPRSCLSTDPSVLSRYYCFCAPHAADSPSSPRLWDGLDARLLVHQRRDRVWASDLECGVQAVVQSITRATLA